MKPRNSLNNGLSVKSFNQEMQRQMHYRVNAVFGDCQGIIFIYSLRKAFKPFRMNPSRPLTRTVCCSFDLEVEGVRNPN